MIFHTLSGSTYELDKSNNRVRRLNGTQDPTPRQGSDGEWKTFESCSDVKEDSSVIFHWEGGRCTLTSTVLSINNSPN